MIAEVNPLSCLDHLWGRESWGLGRPFPSLWPFLPWAPMNMRIQEALRAAHTGHGCLFMLCLKDNMNRKASLSPGMSLTGDCHMSTEGVHSTQEPTSGRLMPGG